MKLLFDENLSARLVRQLAEEFVGSQHVDLVGLRGRPDEEIWNHAAQEGFTIVSKDRDFADMSFVRGHPPKVILLRVGNVGTARVAEFLRRKVPVVERFAVDAEASVLELSDG